MRYLRMTVVSLFTAAAIILPVSPHAAAANTSIEAESMSVSPASAGRVIADSSASGGHALELSQNSTASTNLSLSASISVVIRAKGQSCLGAPSMTVSIDGKAISTTTVSATSWTNYTTAATITAGTHTLSIAFTNALNVIFCSRSLFLDNVTVVGGNSTPPTIQPTGVPGNWTIKFDDEFNGTSLNPNYWKTSWYNGVNRVSLSAANVAVANGNLALTLSSSTVGAAAVTGPVTSTFGFKVGAPCVWEARINFPADASGNYYNWPAFWLLDDSGDGATVEIDVAEVWQGTMQTNYHVAGSSAPSHNYPYLGAGFHVWTINRTTTGKDYVYVDGVLQYTLTTASRDTGLPQYVLLNIGTQGPHQQIPSTVLVDYVRAWIPA